MKLQKVVRGTKDIFFQDAGKFNFIKTQVEGVSKKFGFSEAITPILEFASLFSGHLGEGNDIVNKEMYTLLDKNQEVLALRPEGTAPLVRMLLSNSLTNELPLKFFYFGPMFRYERPQKGRQRQFYQFGVEHFMVKTPLSDAIIILMAKKTLEALNIKAYKIELNNIGTIEEQQSYSQILEQYLQKYTNDLSEESLRRLHSNPLRILDSKNEKDKEILSTAPTIISSLGLESTQYFNLILQYLEDLNINYVVSNNLVRGLDYYTGLVFEFTSSDLGSQSAILAGGRYNNLVKNMGGPDIPAIGFAAGIERLMLLVDNNKNEENIQIAVLALSEVVNGKILKLFNHLTNINNVKAFFIEEGNNLVKKLKKANKLKADFVIIIGEEEISNNSFIIKNLKSGLQKLVNFNNIENLASFLTSK